MVGMAVNGCKWLEIAVNGSKLFELLEGWKWLEMAGMDGNGWT